ncbi:MAG: tripartite tricarboxylate transporter substrate-binding protein [Pseudomonadota bacterium]|nr:tripartite tricarboxylate transporter substrate-binding protein [Pseudomonadota bacterium]
MISRRTTLQAFGAAALSSVAGIGFAQDDKQLITVLVGAASSMDFTARVIADQLHVSLDRPTIVMSRLGAGQRLALGEERRATPDGRTLLFATSGPFAIYPNIYAKLDYDPDRDFTPIAGISTFDVAVSTGPMTGATDMKQVVAWSRAQKGNAVFGSAPGNGSLSHFVGISINLATGLHMTHVPYKDSGVGLIDLAGGRLPIMITGLSPQVELHKAGKIRIVAVSGETRSPLVPEVPTLKEAGINVSSSTSTGLFGPAAMAPELVARIAAALQPMFTNPTTIERLAQQGMTPWSVNNQQLAASIVDERKRFAGIVKASGFVPLTA